MQEPKDLKDKTKKLIGFELKDTAFSCTSIRAIREDLEEQEAWAITSMFESGSSLSEVRKYLNEEYPPGHLVAMYCYSKLDSHYFLPDSCLRRYEKRAKQNVRKQVEDDKRRTQDLETRKLRENHALYAMLHAKFGGKPPEECKPK